MDDKWIDEMDPVESYDYENPHEKNPFKDLFFITTGTHFLPTDDTLCFLNNEKSSIGTQIKRTWSTFLDFRKSDNRIIQQPSVA